MSDKRDFDRATREGGLFTKWARISIIATGACLAIGLVWGLVAYIVDIDKHFHATCENRAWVCEVLLYEPQEDCRNRGGVLLEAPGRPLACDMDHYVIVRHSSLDEWKKYTIE